MGRALASVILGYVVMAAMVVATFSIAYLVLGADRSYQPGTYDVTTLWIVISLVLSIAAAVVGGLTAAAIARSAGPPKVLAAVVLVLGFAMAIYALRAEPPTQNARTTNPSVFEAGTVSRQPTWIALANPILGAVGVLVGAALARKDDVGTPKHSPVT
jgi:amino acid transporter